MARRGENIYLRKDGRWEGRYMTGRKPNGKPIFVSIYAHSYQEVKTQLIILKANSQQQRACPHQKKTQILCEWAKYWLETLLAPHIKQSTLAQYRRNLDKHILPRFGKLPMDAITTLDIQETIGEWNSALSANTINGLCRMLKSLLSAAVQYGKISVNPYQSIRTPKIKRKKPRVLTLGEQAKLETAALASGRLEYILCLYSGLRLGELCALKWEDINWQKGVLSVNSTLQRISRKDKKTLIILDTPKSESSEREVPLPLFMLEMLRHYKATQRKDQVYLFASKKGTPKDPRLMQQHLTSLLSKIDLQGVHMHTLRHTYATRCLENQIGYTALAELLGHSTPRITLDYYAHTTRDYLHQSVGKLKLLAM